MTYLWITCSPSSKPLRGSDRPGLVDSEILCGMLKAAKRVFPLLRGRHKVSLLGRGFGISQYIELGSIIESNPSLSLEPEE